MGIKEFWEERSVLGKELTVALLGGAAAIVFALICGTEDWIALRFGLTVMVALVAVVVLGRIARWFKSLRS